MSSADLHELSIAEAGGLIRARRLSAWSADLADEDTRAMVRVLSRRAGLELSERHFELLCRAAPYALRMTERVRRRRKPSEEPANVFRHQTNRT